MLAPIAGASLGGVLWDQGENNAHYCSVREYNCLFTTMVQAWRKLFPGAHAMHGSVTFLRHCWQRSVWRARCVLLQGRLLRATQPGRSVGFSLGLMRVAVTCRRSGKARPMHSQHQRAGFRTTLLLDCRSHCPWWRRHTTFVRHSQDTSRCQALLVTTVGSMRVTKVRLRDASRCSFCTSRQPLTAASQQLLPQQQRSIVGRLSRQQR
jgi:hypothetical protein